VSAVCNTIVQSEKGNSGSQQTSVACWQKEREQKKVRTKRTKRVAKTSSAKTKTRGRRGNPVTKSALLHRSRLPAPLGPERSKVACGFSAVAIETTGTGVR